MAPFSSMYSVSHPTTPSYLRSFELLPLCISISEKLRPYPVLLQLNPHSPSKQSILTLAPSIHCLLLALVFLIVPLSIMLSFRPPFQNHPPIDCYIKSYQDLFFLPLYPSQHHSRTGVTPMYTTEKPSFLESISEPLILTDPPSRPIQPIDNRPSTILLMNHKRNQPIQLRSAPYSPSPTSQISSFDLEYALLEHALRKDRTSSSVPKTPEDGRPHKCASPPLLEPEFYFGDILGDEAVPPQPLVNMCKDEEKVQPNEVDCVQEHTNFASFEHRLPLSDNNHVTDPHTAILKETEHPETDLSTALASLVSSHVSSESISPKDIARGNGRAVGICSSRKKPQGSLKRSAPDSTVERPTKFTRQMRNSGWALETNRIHQQFYQQLNTNRSSVAETVSSDFQRRDRASTLQQGRMDRNTEVLGELEPMMHSPVSDSSMSGPGIRSHPDLYENLNTDIREKVDRLKQKISAMPRRKLRESLAQGVTLEDIEPLMCLNRDELAGMLGLGVTTLKMFVHNTLGVPRWPARALKSQQVKVQKLVQKKMEAERKGDQEQVKRVQRDLTKMTQVHMRKKELLREEGSLRTKERV